MPLERKFKVLSYQLAQQVMAFSLTMPHFMDLLGKAMSYIHCSQSESNKYDE
jgi:hypothetical protein